MNFDHCKFETKQLHVGQEDADVATGARAVPIYLTTSYVFENSQQAANRFALTEEGPIYTRLENPTTGVFERRMAALEGGTAAIATASGASAIDSAVRNITCCGDHIVSAATLYGGTFNYFSNTLPECGIHTTFVDGSDPANFEAAINDRTRLLYMETMGNPNCNLIDIEAVAEIAHRHGIPLMIDNTFATPYLLRPMEYGADIVIHSATKFIGGHGTVLGGVIVESGKFDWGQNDKFPGLAAPNAGYHGSVFTEVAPNAPFTTKIRATLMHDIGAAISPFHSFLLLQGLETLSLRVERHVENALKVVEYLSKHPQVEKVNHPALAQGKEGELYRKYFLHGGGSIFTVELKGGEAKAKAFTEALTLFSLLANVADGKSLVIHPASTTHSQLSESELREGGITPATVRLSIGTEHIDDILADIEQAFAKIRD